MVQSTRRVFGLIVSFALLAIVAWVDYATGYEVNLGVCYYLPIAYAAWNLGGLWSFSFGVLCAVTITWVEIAGGQPYSKLWIVAEHTLMRVLGFGFVAFSFNYFKRTIEKERDKTRRLEGLTFCTCCHKVREDGGAWSDLDTFLRENTTLRPETKLCPMCAREAYASCEVKSKADSSKASGT